MIVAALAVLVAQLVKGITGFGAALVAVPVLVLVFGPVEAVAIATLHEIVSGGLLLAPVVRRVRPVLIAALFLPMIPAQWVGTELLTRLPASGVRIVVGTMVFGFALRILWRPVPLDHVVLDDLPASRRTILGTAVIAGGLAGVLAGLAATPGPPLVAHLRHWFAPAFFRAHLLGTLFLAGFTLLGWLAWRGALTASAGWTAVVLLLPLAVGSFLGARLAGRIPAAAFGRAVGAVLLVAGSALVLTSVW